MNEKKPAILIVDDEPAIRESFSLILQDDYNVFTVSSGEAALKKVIDTKIDLIFLDIRMPGIDGMETLKRIKDIDRSIEVIMVTAVNDVQSAGESVAIGANNYIVKPFDVPQIISMAKAVIGKRSLRHTTKNIRERSKKQPLYPEMEGYSAVIQAVKNQTEDFSKTDIPVFISAKTGFKPETVAYLIHSKSLRKDGPFCSYNIPQKISAKRLDSILFGEGKGSFTSELSITKGVIENALNGTLLLMNIENAPKPVQEKICDLIKNKEIKRSGSRDIIHSDLRLIFSSSKSLSLLSESEMLVQDLVEHLQRALIEVPTVNERAEDIPYITSSLIEKFNEKHGKNTKEISKEALEIFEHHGWQGDFCELSDTIEMLMVSGNLESIKVQDLPVQFLISSAVNAGQNCFSSEKLYTLFEKAFISHVLKKTGFSLSRTAKTLNINRNILSSKMESLEIS